MNWDLLLSSAIGGVVEFLIQLGLSGVVAELRERLAATENEARRHALEQALQTALAQSGRSDELRSVIEEPATQEAIIEALLDPTRPLDFQALAQEWAGRFPDLQVPLMLFFNTLQNVLLQDRIWGPILQRYYTIRSMAEIREALARSGLASPERELISRVSAVLRGSGAIAQGERSVAVGEGGTYVGGDYHQVVNIVLKQILQPEPALPEEPLRAYLEELARRANLLPWAPLMSDQAHPEKGADLTLDDVYVDLDTTELERVEREEELRQYLARQHELERISAQAMLNREPRLVLLGDPGSGKSTFVKYVTYVLAQVHLTEDPASRLERLSPWEHGPLLPVWVELRQMAAFAREQRVKRGDERLMRQYLRHLVETDLEVEGFWPQLRARIRGEDAPLLFLLDGLDEVPKEVRQVVVDAITDFSRVYGQHRYLVTSRPYAYVGQPWQLPGFHQATLAPFNQKQIKQFIDKWYDRLVGRGRLERRQAEKMRERLHISIERRDLREMAERPLLLTVMAQLNTFRGRLPDDRTELYAEAVRLLLDRWEQRLGEEGILERLDIPGLKMSDLEAGLYDVAFHAHAEMSPDQDTADIPASDIRDRLAPYLGGSFDRANEFVAYIRERAGLLIARKPESYTFPHRTFQEFLAACYLTGTEDYISRAPRLVQEDYDRWREVFVLAAGHAARTHRLGQAVSAVNALLPHDYRPESTPSQEDWRAALLAGEALLEIGLVGATREKVGQVLYERVRRWLLAAMRADDHLPPSTRAAAGHTLAKLGDPREEVLDPLRIEWIEIPAGPFLMGEDEKQYTHDIPYTYWISRYPITNAQFQAFVDAGGYRERRYWTKDGWRWREEKGLTAPLNVGEPWNLSNHPRVAVTWYEAVAFTRWLTERLRENGQLPEGYAVQLPNEPEWEKAARGGLQIPQSPVSNLQSMVSTPLPDRIYPWGNDPDPNRANYYDTGIGTTSAVGCFPGGASPYGVEEMSGNVWEWTRSLWGKYPYPESEEARREREDLKARDGRVVRGGAFYNSRRGVRCSVRYGGLPVLRSWNLGFRVVVSPFVTEH